MKLKRSYYLMAIAALTITVLSLVVHAHAMYGVEGYLTYKDQKIKHASVYCIEYLEVTVTYDPCPGSSIKAGLYDMGSGEYLYDTEVWVIYNSAFKVYTGEHGVGYYKLYFRNCIDQYTYYVGGFIPT